MWNRAYHESTGAGYVFGLPLSVRESYHDAGLSIPGIAQEVVPRTSTLFRRPIFTLFRFTNFTLFTLTFFRHFTLFTVFRLFTVFGGGAPLGTAQWVKFEFGDFSSKKNALSFRNAGP